MTSRYAKLDRLFVGGEWREGSGKRMENICPWDETTIFAMNAATRDDVDEACHAAAEAQREWGALPPSARAAVFARIAGVMEARHDPFSAKDL